MSSQWTGSIEWLEGLKNGIQYRGGFLSMYGFQQPCYWLSHRTANASYMTKWASGNCLPAHKVWEQRIHFWGGLQMFAVSLKVCLRVLTMVCSLEAQYSHTSYLIRKIHTSLRQTRTKCFIFPILEMASETYQSPLEDQWSISDFDSD